MIAPYPRLAGRPNGGVEAAAESLAWALGRFGVEVRIFDPFTGHPDAVWELNHSVVRLPAMASWRSLLPRPPSDLREAIERWNPEVLHVHLGAQLTRMQSPSVLTVHGFPHLESRIRNPGLGGRIRGVGLKLAFDSGVRGASMVVAISPEAKLAADESRVPTVSIPNPIAEEFFRVERDPGKDFVAIGNIMRRKNQLQLIQMFGEYVSMGAEGNLAVVGAIDDREYYDQCKRASRAFSSRVQFLGPLPRKEVSKLLGAARASVSTSLRETSSIAIAESFAANCPVVCLDVGTARSQVKDARFGEVLEKTSTINEMALSLINLRSIPANGEPLRASVADQHPDEVARRTVQLYRSLTDLS
nr:MULTISPECIES: glycosyltransferase [unclassified Dietzia]